MTIAIAYNGGAYGTYLEWCLTTLSSSEELPLPFTDSGSSHAFKGSPPINIHDWSNYLESTHRQQFVRLHPKVKSSDSLSTNMDRICSDADSVIYLYPDDDSILLCLNNFYEKVWDDWWVANFTNLIDPNKIYENWPVERTTDLGDIPIWIQREFLSFFLMPAWFDQIEWCHIDRWQNSKCCVVTISQLLHHFEDTVARIQNHCNISFARDVSTIKSAHQQNLSLQKHLHKDQLCHQILDAVTNNRDLTWNRLTLVDESWLQWSLRNRGLEIRCDGLDTFPTNSLHLQKLLYSV